MKPSKLRRGGASRSAKWLGLGAVGVVLAPAALVAATQPHEVDYDRDVRPILSENCFKCHGFDEKTRLAGLRLDTPEGAYQAMKSGKHAVVPGHPEKSELIRRVTADNGLKMPPESSGKTLKPAEVAILKRWIAQGGKYAGHWAFIPPKRPALPVVKNAAWCVNPIDRFVLARLEAEGLKPSPAADRQTLIRRVTLDLTGLPPTPAEVNAFISDRQPGAYERLVDRLLASPRYGERMALNWLDLARYADTHGYHIDSHRDMWPWRDWVIRSFNNNLPYDQFVVQQLAGDLLPNATLDQKIATGFNRNHPINFEGGAIPEEYQTNYVIDRVDTTATAFMGLTMRCAQCHDHKYDPITQKDYYRFFAYFNNIAENGLDGYRGNAAPFLKAPTADQQAKLAEYDQKIAESDKAVKARVAEAAPALARWEADALPALEKSGTMAEGLLAHYGFDEMGGDPARDACGQQSGGAVRGNPAWDKGQFGAALKLDGQTYLDLGGSLDFDRTDRFSYGAWVKPEGKEAMTVVSRMDDSNGFRGWDLYLQNGQVFVHLINQWDGNAIRVNTKTPFDGGKWHHVFVTYDGSSKAAGVKVYVDGKSMPLDLTHDKLTGTIKTATPVHIGRRNPGAVYRGLIDEVRIYNRDLAAAEVADLAAFDPLRQVAAIPAAQRSAEQKETLRRYYLEKQDEPYRRLSASLADWQKKRTELDAAIPTSMVMQERDQPRETFMLIRGQYDKKGDKVTPGVPQFLPPLPASAPGGRLALAQWLVSPTHPLTSRVAVNRFWEMYFGAGIVRTTENFGLQSERPTHPELLDWLATTFIGGLPEKGLKPWDVKGLQRLIVTSATYRQSSANPKLADPENRLLARGPRFRLPAEFVRDQALLVSGLLVEQPGGPSVRPYQPPGLWEDIAFGGDFTAQKYVQDHGEALYRRSMYTFWKRTCPPPALQTFDAPEREFCIVRRSVTNTPLQALVLMNDVTYVEASRKFAERLLTEVAATPKDRIVYAYRLALGRMPRNEEIRVLLGVYQKQLERFQKDRPAAEKLLAVGESRRNEKLDAAELAAWTGVANVIFNLDEMITKG